MEKVVIFGTGVIGQLAHFYFSHDSDFKVVAFTADDEYVESDELLGLPVVKFSDVARLFPPEQYSMFVALSYINMNRTRANRYNAVKRQGYKLVSYVCSKSVFWGDTRIGENVFIFENQTIQPNVTIGDDVMIWSGNHIGHHAEIGNHCWISTHVILASKCKIEDYVFIGINASVRNHVTVAAECIIGAGALVLKDTVAKGVYIGSPAKLYHHDSTSIKQI